MKRSSLLVFCTLFLIAFIQGCGNSNDEVAKAVKPAKVESKVVNEVELSTLTLTPEARDRLGIQTEKVAYRTVPKFYSAPGEIVVPPGYALIVEAPIAGYVKMTSGKTPVVGQRVSKDQDLFQLTPLLPVERDLRVNAESDVAAAVTRLEVAKTRAARADQMLRDGVGSVRSKEDADEAVRLAATALDAARSRLKQIESDPVSDDIIVAIKAPQNGILRQIHIAEDQLVSAGSVLCEIVRFDPVWVRTPVYSGDVDSLVKNRNAKVRSINAAADSTEWQATPVDAPPTADPLSGTTDMYYRLANRDRTFHPGERVSMSIPMKGETECLHISRAAILYDIHGGAWVYENIEPLVYTRRRVEVESISGNSACLSEGPGTGAAIVTDGAAELFGTEFGAGK